MIAARGLPSTAMSNDAKNYKVCARVGPGGIRCPCCTKGVPSETKRLANRRFRRSARKAIREES